MNNNGNGAADEDDESDGENYKKKYECWWQYDGDYDYHLQNNATLILMKIQEI